MLRYWTAGESHGKGLLALLDGFPAGLTIDTSFINAELKRRQSGYGRGGRQQIESDEAEVLTGIYHGQTTGAPITLWVGNRDVKIDIMPDLDAFRPGHGDLAGFLKYQSGIRPVLERASARETAAKVAAGSLAQLFLREIGIGCAAYVVSLGTVPLQCQDVEKMPLSEILDRRGQSELFSLTPERDEEAKALIGQCQLEGDSLGGIIEVRVTGVPFGLGTHTQWDLKLDGRLAQAVMSVQAIKGVEIGLGFEAARRRGSDVHDPIFHDDIRGFYRSSNNAGGLEAGMTNSEPIVLRAAMKPIPTIRKPLPSVNRETREPMEASYERSDVCAVPAASVVLQAVTALEIAKALTEKYGSDHIRDYPGTV
jgi:chorismate synthase